MSTANLGVFIWILDIKLSSYDDFSPSVINVLVTMFGYFPN